MKYIKSKERYKYELLNENILKKFAKNLYDKILNNIVGGPEIKKTKEQAFSTIDGLFKKQLDVILARKAAQNNQEDKSQDNNKNTTNTTNNK